MIITLLTDFGSGSPYAAAMKGVILSLNPAAQMVDLTHDAPPQDVRFAALFLDDVAERFPAGTLHLAVVDPGVGTDRALLYAQLGTQHYLAPDNGLLSRVAFRRKPARIVQLTESRHWPQPASATFHGRDILAPVAARLSLGLDPAALGAPLEKLHMLDWPRPHVAPGRVDGHVLWIDRFGNLSTNITLAALAAAGLNESLSVTCCGRTSVRHVGTYGLAAPGELVSLIGSSDRLELAVVEGNAAARLGAAVNDPVNVAW